MASRGKTFWARITHQWSWLDSLIGFLFGVVCGVLGVVAFRLLFLEGMNTSSVIELIHPSIRPIGLLVGCAFFFNRCWAIARYPRPERVDLAKLGLWGFLHQNFVALTAAAISIAFALAMAPESVRLIEAVLR